MLWGFPRLHFDHMTARLGYGDNMEMAQFNRHGHFVAGSGA